MYKFFIKTTASAGWTDITENVTRDSLRIEENIQEKANVAVFALESIGSVQKAQEVKIFDTAVLVSVSTTTLLTVNDLSDKVKKFRVNDNIWIDGSGDDEEKVSITAINTFSKTIAISTASQTHSVGTIVGVKKFAGHLTKVVNKNLHQLTNVVYGINAIDYTKEFDRKLINDSFEDKTAKEIVDEFVKEVVNPGLSSTFTTSLMETGSSFDNLRAAFKSPMEIMQRLAEADGSFAWWIDYDKNIHYKSFGQEVAPFSLTTLSNNFIDLEILADLNKVKNRQVVLGGLEDSSERVTEFHKGDANKREWVLRSLFSDLTMAVGTFSASMTTVSVLPDHINTEVSADYFSNYVMQSVRAAATTSTLAATDVIRFRYNEKVPINVLDEDLVSITALKNLGFGDGVIEGRPIINKSIDKRSEAEDVARAELLKHSNTILSAKFTTEEQGLHPGQVIKINDSNRNINQDFLIQRVKEVIYAGDKSRYEITCASSLLGITELVQKLLKAGEKVQLDEDVGIDLLKLLREKISMTASWAREGEEEQIEVVSFTESLLKENQTPPFLWGQDPDLVGWWKLDDDLADTNVIDSSDNGNDGTLEGSDNTEDKSVNGIAKKAFDFNGSDDQVALTSTVTLTGTFTLSFWIKRNLHTGYRFILSGPITGTQVKIGQSSKGAVFFIRILDGGSDDTSVSLPSTGDWHLITITRDSNNKVDLYIDNGITNRLYSGAAQSGNTTIATIGSGSGTQYWWGLIDDVRVYDRVLTNAEKLALQNNPLYNTNAPQGRWNLAQYANA